jgi:Spy/CpxP family protein refolding chaperone
MMASARMVSLQASKVTCVVTVTLVFLAGAAAGAVAMNLGLHRYMHRPEPFYTVGGKEIWLQRWKKELALTPEQSAEMGTILDDFVTYYRNVLSDGKGRILKILNAEQQKKLNKLLEEQR